MSHSATSRHRLSKVLRDELVRHDLQLAECGNRFEDAIPLDPATGLLPEEFSKPPRWIVHLRKAGKGITLQVPEGTKARRLGFLNAQGGRRVGGVSFRVLLAQQRPSGWELVEGAEWSLFFLRTTPLPPGSSSEPIDGYVPETGTMRYRGEDLAFSLWGIGALEDGAHPLRTYPPMRYRDATAALASLIHHGANRAAEVWDLTSVDTPNQLAAQIRATLVPDVAPSRSLDTVLNEFGDEVETAFLSRVVRLSAKGRIGFAHALLTQRGFSNIKCHQRALEGRDVLVCAGIATEPRGLITVLAHLYLDGKPIGTSELRRLQGELRPGSRGTLIAVGRKADDLLPSSGVEIFAGSEFFHLSEGLNLGTRAREVSAAEIDHAFWRTLDD